MTNGWQFCFCAVQNNDTITTATSGWTKIAQVNSGSGFTVALFTAKLGAATPSFQWTNAAHGHVMGGAFDSGSYDIIATAVASSTSNTGNTSPHTATGLTAVHPDGMTLALAVVSAGQSTSYGAASAGWTNRWNQGTSATINMRSVMATRDDNNPGATGDVSWTHTANPWVAFQIELDVSNEAGPQLDVAEMELAVPHGEGPLSAREMEVSALLKTSVGLDVPEMEVAALLSVDFDPDPPLNVQEMELAYIPNAGAGVFAQELELAALLSVDIDTDDPLNVQEMEIATFLSVDLDDPLSVRELEMATLLSVAPVAVRRRPLYIS
jgi:hypothetical protein